MPTAFIIHGSMGSPLGNWFPWLKTGLERLGFEVVAPQFPGPPNQTFEDWLPLLQPHLKKADEKSIFIAHSLGPAFVLQLLEKTPAKASACYFVAGFTEKLGIMVFDSANASLIGKPLDWKSIRKKCPKFVCFASSNDPYVPMEKTKSLNDNLQGEFVLVQNAGHFMKSDGFERFPVLLERIKRDSKP